VLERAQVTATFLFSLGPDHTGRAIRRVFRPGFLSKVRRTSVVANYGLRTLLYGTLLPGPRIAARCRDVLRETRRRGHEVGVHVHDHVEWQDRVATADERWTRREFVRACEIFEDVFQIAPRVHGAAGWQTNVHLLRLEREFGFTHTSDTRGSSPFVPLIGDESAAGPAVPQWPTTLPTLDELVGHPQLEGRDPVDHLLGLTAGAPLSDHVYTLHAELEGAAYLDSFARLLRGWREQGYALVTLAQHAADTDGAKLPIAPIVAGEVPGRSGRLAVRGAQSS
jgi:peptidoglycan/xylan/chitin deacetylase (PgdA/CDA1 family)